MVERIIQVKQSSRPSDDVSSVAFINFMIVLVVHFKASCVLCTCCVSCYCKSSESSLIIIPSHLIQYWYWFASVFCSRMYTYPSFPQYFIYRLKLKLQSVKILLEKCYVLNSHITSKVAFPLKAGFSISCDPNFFCERSRKRVSFYTSVQCTKAGGWVVGFFLH